MPPRLYLKRLFILLVFCGSCAILLTNLKQNWVKWSGYREDIPVTTAAPVQMKQLKYLSESIDVITEAVVLPQNQEKPWFMVGGTLRPSPANKTK